MSLSQAQELEQQQALLAQELQQAAQANGAAEAATVQPGGEAQSGDMRQAAPGALSNGVQPEEGAGDSQAQASPVLELTLDQQITELERQREQLELEVAGPEVQDDDACQRALKAVRKQLEELHEEQWRQQALLHEEQELQQQELRQQQQQQQQEQLLDGQAPLEPQVRSQVSMQDIGKCAPAPPVATALLCDELLGWRVLIPWRNPWMLPATLQTYNFLSM